MQHAKLPLWTWSLPLLPLLLVIAWALSGNDLYASLRNHLFDQYQRWNPRTYVEAPVRIIDIDDASLERLGQWPWPRTRIAALIDQLQAAGVAAIGFDVMFAESDRTSPASAVGLWPLSPPLQDALGKLPDHDAVLARHMRQAPVVLGFALDRSKADETTRAPLLKAAIVHLGEPQVEWLHPFNSAVASLAILEKAGRGNGALTFVPDSDGIVRRVPLVLRLGEQPLPTLVSETLRVAQGTPLITLRSAGHEDQLPSEHDHAGLGEIRIGQARIPTTEHGEFWIHYSRHRPERSLPAWKLFSPDFPAETLAGQIVLIGSSAQGLMDLRFSPFGLIPGVEAHAQALEQILSDQFLERPNWAPSIEILVLLACGLLIGVIALKTSAMLGATICLGMLAALAGGAWYAFVAHHLLLDVAMPMLGTAGSFIVGSLAHHLFSEREQRWVRDAFSRYVSPNRVNYLIENPDDMALGGRRQTCSFIFTDLAGFTSLMEKIDPGEAVALLNTYLDAMIEIAFRHEGTLDRIVGDAVAIMFSAPVVQKDHRARALGCALEMDRFARVYAMNLQSKGIPFGNTRIGVHAGEVIVGNFGGKNIFDYRALGDPVNTASRLESVNKHLGTRICVSGDIISECPDVPVRPVGRLVLKGKSKALEVFEPITEDSYPRAPLDAYRAAYATLADNPAEASRRFSELADTYPDDPLVRLHLNRLQAGQSGDTIVMDAK